MIKEFSSYITIFSLKKKRLIVKPLKCIRIKFEVLTNNDFLGVLRNIKICETMYKMHLKTLFEFDDLFLLLDFKTHLHNSHPPNSCISPNVCSSLQVFFITYYDLNVVT